MSKALARAIDCRDKAERRVDLVLKRDYPPETSLKWMRNGLHEGVVIQNGYGDRIKVKNDRTGKELWIYAWNITEAQKASD
jgi:hypothetical protein